MAPLVLEAEQIPQANWFWFPISSGKKQIVQLIPYAAFFSIFFIAITYTLDGTPQMSRIESVGAGVAGALWLLMGLMMEYLPAILGGRLHFNWLGPRAIVSIVVHFLVLVVLFFIAIIQPRLGNPAHIYVALMFLWPLHLFSAAPHR
jgi:hypothetical protein